ncbi:tyrosine-type recombinase/integrase [Enterococcus sp. AZ007]|uniref:tyrosine-type recombinase/integrase n=1 Tax=Enterococcus sp. AZ007 TaxID=2774839 RepID=UPI003F23CB0D
MDVKDQFINAVVSHMEPELEVSQLRRLKLILTMDISKYRIEESRNEVVIYDETSDIAAYKQYLISLKLRNLSDGTINLTIRTIDKFLRTIRKPYKEITTWDIKSYIANRKMVDHISSATLDRERGAVCRYFKWLYEEDYLPKDIGKKVEKIKVEKRLKKAFTPIEVELIRNACVKPKEKAVVEMLLSTGCRVSELVSLTMENYDVTRGQIPVIGKGNKERMVFINPKAKVAIDNYLEVKPHIFGPIICGLKGPGSAMSANGIQKMIKAIAKRAGVAHAHPHKFRRTAATFALRQGMPINDVRIFLGHSDLDTTKEYIDVTGIDFKQIHDKYVA